MNDKDPLNMFKKILNRDYTELSPIEKMKNEAVANDRRLQDLATYEVTKGLTVPLMNLQDTLPKFAEYKMLVKRGSFTIEQLEERVMRKYAIVSVTEDQNAQDPLADMVIDDEDMEF